MKPEKARASQHVGERSLTTSDVSELRREPIPLGRLNALPHSKGNTVVSRAMARSLADARVKLQYASSFYWSGAGQAGRAVTMEAVVTKIGSLHSVQAHYNPGNGGPWVDLNVPLLLDCGSYLVFRLSESQFPIGSELEFCLKCTVDGATIWDNNDWQNYRLPGTDARIMPGNVCLEHADVVTYLCPGWMSAYCSNLSGTLLVRDLDYVKYVGIRYTWDAWQSWIDEPAHWVQNFYAGGLQAWEFHANRYTASSEGSPEFEFAVFYRDGRTGLWFWDNNFGQNFRIQDPGLTHLE